MQTIFVEARSVEESLEEIIEVLKNADDDSAIKLVISNSWVANIFRRRDYAAWALYKYRYSNGKPVSHRDHWKTIIELTRKKTLFVSGCYNAGKEALS